MSASWTVATVRYRNGSLRYRGFRSPTFTELLLPATAESPIKLHEVLELGAARLGECEFSGKE